MLERHALLGGEALQARHQVVEVDLVPVEVRAVDARELDLVADLHAAAAAHAGAVDHQRIEAHHRLDAVRARRLGAALHHDRRADRHAFVDVGMALDREPDALGDGALDAGRAVVGAHDHLVADRAELVVPEHEVLVAEADDADHVGAGFLERARLRERRRDAEAAADAQHLLRVTERARHAHRADHRVQRAADLGSSAASPASSCRRPGSRA